MKEEYWTYLYEEILRLRDIKNRHPTLAFITTHYTPNTPEYYSNQNYYTLLERAEYLIVELDKPIEEVMIILKFPTEFNTFS